MKCPKCENIYETILFLSKHWVKTHKETTEKLYQEFYGITQKFCECGCGQPTKFLDAGRGYSTLIRGHGARIKNNFQSEKSIKNSLATRQKMLETGEWKPFASKETGEHWSKGLTKETDERIAKMAETISSNEEEIKRRSERMKKGRLDGTVPTLYGKDHSQWKGGTSSLLPVCHSNKKLFDNWKYPKLCASNFTCQKCDVNKKIDSSIELEVHHDEEKMSDIVRKIAIENGWTDYYAISPSTDEKTQELKNKIADAVANYHIENNVSAIVLCESCHKKEHNKYNL